MDPVKLEPHRAEKHFVRKRKVTVHTPRGIGNQCNHSMWVTFLNLQEMCKYVKLKNGRL